MCRLVQHERPVAAEAGRRSACRLRDAGPPRAAGTAAAAPFRDRSTPPPSPWAGWSAWLPCLRRAGHRDRSGRMRSVTASPVSGSVPSTFGPSSAPSPSRRRTAGAELAGVVAFGIVRAADEGAELAELQRQLAGRRSSGRRAGRMPSSRGGKTSGASSLVQRVEHVGDAQFLGLVDWRGEFLPELAQHVLPVELAGGDLVELFLEIGGEVVLDVALEEVFEEGRDQPALGLGDELALRPSSHIRGRAASQRRGIGRRPADAELFHLLDQRRFGVARRRLGEVLRGLDRALGEILAWPGSPAAARARRPRRRRSPCMSSRCSI